MPNNYARRDEHREREVRLSIVYFVLLLLVVFGLGLVAGMLMGG